MKRLIFTVMLLVITGLYYDAYASSLEHWNTSVIRAKINSRFEFEIYNRSRWRELVFNETYQNCIQPGIRYKLIDNFKILLAYRYDVQDKGVYYEFENRFLVDFNYSLPKFLTLSHSLSQRTELRYFTRSSTDHVRIRFKYGFSRGFAIQKQEIKPSLAYEVFWDDSAEEINRQRVYAAISTPISRWCFVQLTLISQYDNGRDDLYIFNSSLTMNF